jgi:hypothetical protein
MMGKYGPQWMTVKEFLDGPLGGMTTMGTVYRAIREGFIPHTRISKRRILIPHDALDQMASVQPVPMEVVGYQRLLAKIFEAPNYKKKGNNGNR